MKFSNFVFTHKKGGLLNQTLYGTVDIEEGFFFKKKRTVAVYQSSVYWRFFDTGEYCPNEVDYLANSQQARDLLARE